MFTALFGKRRSSPVEGDTPPIPGPKTDNDFVIIDPNSSSSGGLYPSMTGVPGAPGVPVVPYPQRPAPPVPGRSPHRVDPTFHYLQGVPFVLSKDLQMSANKDAFATEIGDLLAFLTSRLNMSGFSYDFSAERSVLKEC